jgi:hypothetical protein
MRNSKLHIIVRSILLCSVVFFSTGFTTIVKYCSMSQSSECCCESDHSSTAAAQSNGPSVADEDSSCFIVKVVGGLNDIKAPATSEFSIKMLAIDAILLVPEVIAPTTPTHFLSLAYTDDVAPPNGNICICNSLLLI